MPGTLLYYKCDTSHCGPMLVLPGYYPRTSIELSNIGLPNARIHKVRPNVTCMHVIRPKITEYGYPLLVLTLCLSYYANIA